MKSSAVLLLAAAACGAVASSSVEVSYIGSTGFVSDFKAACTQEACTFDFDYDRFGDIRHCRGRSTHGKNENFARDILGDCYLTSGETEPDATSNTYVHMKDLEPDLQKSSFEFLIIDPSVYDFIHYSFQIKKSLLNKKKGDDGVERPYYEKEGPVVGLNDESDILSIP